GESAPVEVTTAVEARFQLGAAPIRPGRVFYGHIERLGPPRRGRLTLRAGEVMFQPLEGEERRWPLDALTALQSSSGTLQIKPRREGVVSFRFPDSSVRLWEEVLRASIRRFYRSAGKGEVLEFQPRIVLR
ncbi:MAG: hypothetical protein HY703_09925, partial [Gemmatimonadetes bacterium]|nr:hypothetical protein [Gemmatimonadota bacterium]